MCREIVSEMHVTLLTDTYTRMARLRLFVSKRIARSKEWNTNERTAFCPVQHRYVEHDLTDRKDSKWSTGHEVRRKVKGSDSLRQDRVCSWSGVAVIAFKECARTVRMNGRHIASLFPSTEALITIIRTMRGNGHVSRRTKRIYKHKRSNDTQSSARLAVSRLSVRASTERNLERLWRSFRENSRRLVHSSRA